MKTIISHGYTRIAALSLVALSLFGRASAQAPDFTKAHEEALHFLSELVKIDTSNPPGNEVKAAEYIKGVLAAEGISAQIYESAPGRGNLVARLKGNGKKLEDIKGQKVNLVELSVSHYLLVRALTGAGMRERDVKIINTSDADVVAAFSTPASTAVVTWKPQLSAVLAMPNAQLVFDSSKIPGEILDLMVVNTATLNANPKLGKALIGAWYETLSVMSKNDAAAKAAQAAMAKASGTDVAGYASQLATTHLFVTPADAYQFVTGDTLIKNMDLVRRFSFDHGILGRGAGSVDAVGIQFPAGKLLGEARNVKMRFDPAYLKMALDGTF